jgi:hypothetical protein
VGSGVLATNTANLQFGGSDACFALDEVKVYSRVLVPEEIIDTNFLILGDSNGDGMVDVGDMGILAANYGQSGKTWAQGDFNGDCKVDVGDMGILAAHYGEGSTNPTNFSDDHAKAFGTTIAGDTTNDAENISSSVCSGLGLPFMAGLALMGLMLVKLEE